MPSIGSRTSQTSPNRLSFEAGASTKTWRTTGFSGRDALALALEWELLSSRIRGGVTREGVRGLSTLGWNTPWHVCSYVGSRLLQEMCGCSSPEEGFLKPLQAVRGGGRTATLKMQPGARKVKSGEMKRRLAVRQQRTLRWSPEDMKCLCESKKAQIAIFLRCIRAG